jgi:hypothetical protein
LIFLVIAVGVALAQPDREKDLASPRGGRPPARPPHLPPRRLRWDRTP